MLLSEGGESPLAAGRLQAVQAGVRAVGQKVPSRASALGALAAECVLCEGDGLHRDLRAWLSCGVVHMRAGVILGAQLHS